MIVNFGTKVITVYKTDSFMSLVGGSVYAMDTNAFRLAVNDRLDDADGMGAPDVFNHNTSVLLGGIDYARIIEIINGYTITFDDTGGAWVCNLIGSNNNILDVTNLTSVQVRSNNSAGLINVREIQQDIFGGVITVDAANGTSGTIYPAGTPLQPVNNMADAKTIAQIRGIDTMFIIGNITLSADSSIANYKVIGQNPILTTVTINASADVTNCEFINCSIVNSVLDGNNLIRECAVANLTYVEGILYNCALSGNIQIATATNTYFFDCKSGCTGLGTSDLPVIDLSNGETHLALRNWSGPVQIENSNNADTTCCIDVTSGAIVTLDSTVSAGTYYLRGTIEVQDNSTGTATISRNATLEPVEIHETYKLAGLDPNAPMTVTPTSRAAGDITQQISGDGETTSTVTRI